MLVLNLNQQAPRRDFALLNIGTNLAAMPGCHERIHLPKSGVGAGKKRALYYMGC